MRGDMGFDSYVEGALTPASSLPRELGGGG